MIEQLDEFLRSVLLYVFLIGRVLTYSRTDPATDFVSLNVVTAPNNYVKFGTSVSLGSSTDLLVGAPENGQTGGQAGDKDGRGRAYKFSWNATSSAWDEQTIHSPDSFTQYSDWGVSVAMGGIDTYVLGSSTQGDSKQGKGQHVTTVPASYVCSIV